MSRKGQGWLPEETFSFGLLAVFFIILVFIVLGATGQLSGVINNFCEKYPTICGRVAPSAEHEAVAMESTQALSCAISSVGGGEKYTTGPCSKYFVEQPQLASIFFNIIGLVTGQEQSAGETEKVPSVSIECEESVVCDWCGWKIDPSDPEEVLEYIEAPPLSGSTKSEVYEKCVDILPKGESYEFYIAPEDPSGYATVKECRTGVSECTIKNFHLPEDFGGMGVNNARDFIRGYGDPSFVIYYQNFPQGEDRSWKSFSSWRKGMVTALIFSLSGFNAVVKPLGKGVSWVATKVKATKFFTWGTRAGKAVGRFSKVPSALRKVKGVAKKGLSKVKNSRFYSKKVAPKISAIDDIIMVPKEKFYSIHRAIYSKLFKNRLNGKIRNFYKGNWRSYFDDVDDAVKSKLSAPDQKKLIDAFRAGERSVDDVLSFSTVDDLFRPLSESAKKKVFEGTFDFNWKVAKKAMAYAGVTSVAALFAKRSECDTRPEGDGMIMNEPYKCSDEEAANFDVNNLEQKVGRVVLGTPVILHKKESRNPDVPFYLASPCQADINIEREFVKCSSYVYDGKTVTCDKSGDFDGKRGENEFICGSAAENRDLYQNSLSLLLDGGRKRIFEYDEDGNLVGINFYVPSPRSSGQEKYRLGGIEKISCEKYSGISQGVVDLSLYTDSRHLSCYKATVYNETGEKIWEIDPESIDTESLDSNYFMCTNYTKAVSGYGALSPAIYAATGEKIKKMDTGETFCTVYFNFTVHSQNVKETWDIFSTQDPDKILEMGEDENGSKKLYAQYIPVPKIDKPKEVYNIIMKDVINDDGVLDTVSMTDSSLNSITEISDFDNDGLVDYVSTENLGSIFDGGWDCIAPALRVTVDTTKYEGDEGENFCYTTKSWWKDLGGEVVTYTSLVTAVILTPQAAPWYVTAGAGVAQGLLGYFSERALNEWPK